MWTHQCKPGYYIQGSFDKETCTVLYSPSGFGYEWRKECKNLQAAKLAVSKHIREACLDKKL